MPLHNFRQEPNVLPGLDLIPIVGESAWHQITIDPTIRDVSRDHLKRLKADIGRHLSIRGRPVRVLEVAAYAHVAGYMLTREIDAEVTLFDVSASTLRLGRDTAREDGIDTPRVRRIAGDFHDMPFDDGAFDVVYICSALHHTWRWEKVLAELVRVTAPGGITILDNEPCRRELCFYSFRTNRPHEFSPAEKAIERTGLMRTIAEPYLGSRPELLFGMTENQEMTLERMFQAVAASSRFEELQLTPDICMGEVEVAADKAFRKGAQAARAFVQDDIGGRISALRTELAAGLAGPPTPLPGDAAVAAMAAKIAAAVGPGDYGDVAPERVAAQLMGGDRALAERSGLERLLRADRWLGAAVSQARMFGAGVRIVARREAPVAAHAGSVQRPRPGEDRDGVLLGFDARTLEIMDPARALLPPIQSTDPQVLAGVFGADWAVEQHGVLRVVRPVVARPALKVAGGQSSHYLVFFRVYIVGIGEPWRLHLVVNGERQCYVDVHQSESALLLSTVANVFGPLNLSFDCTSIDGTRLLDQAPFNVSHCGALAVS